LSFSRVSVISNLIVVTLAFVEQLPPTYRFMLVFNCVLVNMMGGRVFRNTKLGLAREKSISSSSLKPTDASKTLVGPQRPLDENQLLQGPEDGPSPSTQEDESPMDPNARRTKRIRIAILSLIVVILIILPFVCIIMCRQLKDHH